MNFVRLAGWLAGWSLCVADFVPIFNCRNHEITDFQEEKSPPSRFTTAPELRPPVNMDQNAVPPVKNSELRPPTILTFSSAVAFSPTLVCSNFRKCFQRLSGGEILESALHRMQESLKMFDFCGRKRRSTYTLTIGRGKTLSKKN